MIRQPGHALPLLRAAALRLVENALSDLPLMERAGLAAAELAGSLCEDHDAPVLIVAGPGNNGGDALVAARHLRKRFHVVDVVLAGEAQQLPTDAAAAWKAFVDEGGSILSAIPDRRRWGIVIDGLLGIGLSRPVTGQLAEMVVAMNDAAADSRCPLLALDCPSGLDADTGVCRGATVTATHTLSFLAAKPGLLTHDGPDHCGEIRVAALGVDLAALIPSLDLDPATCGDMIGRDLFSPNLRRRPRNSHKGSFGAAGILGGAPGMTGAAILAGRAAIRLGAGRVYLGLPDGLPGDFDPLQPELMLRDTARLFEAPLTAIACGPGLGTDEEAGAALDAAIDTELPLVLDADALNLLAREEEFRISLATRTAQTVLTPHPAEAARLLDVTVSEIQADRIGAACEIASRYGVRVVLKGCGTIIADAEGHWWLNPSGNPGLATAGSGDVLTGMLVALIAQNWPVDAATFAAVHLHGRAAEALATEIGGDIGVSASELADAARALFNAWIADAN